YHKLRLAIKEICKTDGIPNIKWGMYIAFGEKLLKSYLKMKAGSASSDMIAEYINNAISAFSSRTGISQETAQKIADFITSNY
nr:Chain A, Crystal structure of ORF132 of the archaeal virus Acidianus Filamentous Virus 1 (AFV1) [Captovirus AFV1]